MAFHSPSPCELFANNGWLRPEAVESSAFKALQNGVSWATDTRWDSVRTPHLFMGLLSVADRRVREWCRMVGSDPESLLLQFAALFTQPPETPSPIVRLHREFLSENTLRVLRAAHGRARDAHRDRIRNSDLLVALFAVDRGIVADCFAEVGYPAERLEALAVTAEERNLES